jgi:hypothetical protein
MKILLGVLMVAVLIGIHQFMVSHDEKPAQSAQHYKECIQHQYGMTPEMCRDANGGVYCKCF